MNEKNNKQNNKQNNNSNDIITKPISIVYNEFVSNIIKIVNQSNLPFFVIEQVLKDIYNDIKILSKKQLEEDIKQYNIKNNNKNNNYNN